MTASPGDRRLLLFSSAILVGLWQLASVAVNQPILLPSPLETSRALGQIFLAGDLFVHVLTTLWRSLLALGLAFFVSLVLAGLSYAYRSFRVFLRPLVLTVRSLPTIAVILLALIWLKSQGAPLFVGFLILFPTLYEMLLSGLDGIDGRLIEMVEVFKVGRVRRLRALYLPALFLPMRAALAAGAGLGIKVIIAAEVLSQPRSGIGAAMHLEKIYLHTAGVFAWALVALFAAGLLERGAKHLVPKDLRTKPKS